VVDVDTGVHTTQLSAPYPPPDVRVGGAAGDELATGHHAGLLVEEVSEGPQLHDAQASADEGSSVASRRPPVDITGFQSPDD
jgi:hypothetical protein